MCRFSWQFLSRLFILPSVIREWKRNPTEAEAAAAAKRKEASEMTESIQHRTVSVNGINMHVAEKGEGPVILFIHGFPELWYSWRHQILDLASLGYRAIAPDLRGYGDTDAPELVSSYTCFHIVGDLIALLDAVVSAEEKVFVVGHDWGAIISWYLCQYRPDRVKALVNMSVPFNRRHPQRKPIETLKAVYGDDFYIIRFQVNYPLMEGLGGEKTKGIAMQEPGEIEAEFAEMGTSRVMEEFLTYRNPKPLMLPKGKGFGHPLDTPISLPPWLTQEDIYYYASKFQNKGFTGPVNFYRNLNTNWELNAPFTGAQVKVPVKFIVGDLDLTYNFVGTKEYIHGGEMKKDVPFLQEVVVMEGVGHFIQEEKPHEISDHIYDFIKKY